MTRTFSTLAVLLTFAMIATALAGVWSFSLDKSDPWRQEVFLVHFHLGLWTSIGALFVHCIIFTYFLGTGRWVKEVGIAYRLPDDPLPKKTRELKRATFPPALFSMLIAIFTSAAGAGVLFQSWPWYVHATGAVLTLLINLWAFRVEYRNLAANSEILNAVLMEVDRIRQAQGLESNAMAVARDASDA
jgi:amino acid transporter